MNQWINKINFSESYSGEYHHRQDLPMTWLAMHGHENSEATTIQKESVAVIIGALTIHARRNDHTYACSSKI